MEVFKDVPGYEGYYQVSNLGRVKSVERNKKTKWGGYHLKKPCILKLKKNKYGYVNITLAVNSKRTYFSVHKLLAMAFIPNPENKNQVNHKNGIKDDNRLENLEWCTRTENMKHAISTGLWNLKGEKSPNANLSNKDVIEARMCYRLGSTRRELCEHYNISKAAMQRILTNKTYIKV